MDSLSRSQARRIAIAAQGLHRARPSRAVTMRDVQGVIDRLGLLQIDSVNVLARAHLMPLFSRLGPYDVTLLDRAAGRAPRRLVETWAHVASFVAPETYRLLAWRRRQFATEAWGSISGVALSHSEVVAQVRALVTDRGPVTAREISGIFEADHPRTHTEWGWNWTVAKKALEFLFFTGEVAVARRNASFERCYDLTERVLPPAVLRVDPVDDETAVRALLEIGARAHGVGTLRCFQDYFRLKLRPARVALAELVEEGTLIPVEVDGWAERTYVHRAAPRSRRVTQSALLSPFDPLVFERNRLECLFGLRYRIEIYVPAAQRVYGYYVLPFLEGERMTARVDLKADRAAGRLCVQSAHSEPCRGAETPALLAAELRIMARWLGLGGIWVAPVGDLAGPLAAEIASAT